jgi:hypothetical protein
MSRLAQFDAVHTVPGTNAFSYRTKASRLGRQAWAERDEAKMLRLLQEALAWIELAQNEELLAGAGRPQRLQ